MVVAERPKAKKEVDNRPLTVMNVGDFYEVSDEQPSVHETYDAIEMAVDSYIILFSGRRGGGKTTAMSYFSAQEMAVHNTRVLSNYPIEFMLARRVNGEIKYFTRISEKLDLYKLLCFDKDYHNCLIVMDEAPDIISHMSAQTWKNRLLNIFVRQLRKNNNSLMMGAQSMGFIDKSMRWQVDIEIECKDGKKVERNPSLTKGSIIYLRWLDHSGVWTGQSTEERLAYAHAYHMHEPDPEAADHSIIHAHQLWGDKTHKPVFDTYYQQDVWESLMRVDMHLNSYQVGEDQDNNAEGEDGGPSFNEKAMALMGKLSRAGVDKIPTKEIAEALKGINGKQRYAFRQALNIAGIGHDKDGGTLDRYYLLSGKEKNGREVHFDLSAFAQALNKEAMK
ncbi:MAG TPA: hypothetical protein VMR45_04020 [Patescibacteria group bacterium]|nr:hypothetical protein [Patescibacteria group bacterium]